jgi:hypothetical protein
MNDFSYFTKALDEVFETELDDYVNDIEIDESHKFSEKYNRKMAKLIKRREKSYFALICTAGRRAACVVVALFVIFSSAISVKAVREAVYDFVMKIFSNHTEVSVDSDTDNNYPKSIEDEYYISQLPDGFEQTDYNKTANSITVTYFNDDEYIFFDQYTKDVYLAEFDNENSTLESFTDEYGQEYLIQDTGYDYTFVWDNGDYIIQITSNTNKNKALELCKHTKVK